MSNSFNYRLLGKSGLKVSPLCLGTMTFGSEWGFGADKEESLAQYSLFRDAGGNFIDTANLYTAGTSERFLGEFMEGHREDVVLATKYSLKSDGADINKAGNSRKNMMQAVEASLKRLKTDYIDLYYLHAWDYFTPIEEVMRAFDDLVRQGKVLYCGISDTPAWIVSRGQTMAELKGLSPFVALQIEYSLIQRSVEMELEPMANELGMAIMPWAPLAGGALSGKYIENKEAEGRVKPESLRRNERSTAIAKVVLELSKELGFSPVQIALRWLMQKPGTVIPIVGARNSTQLSDSLKAMELHLPKEALEKLNEVSKIETWFPHDFLKQASIDDALYNGYRNRVNK